MDSIAQQKRIRHVENFLHGAQIGRMSEEDVAGKGTAAHVGVRVGRDDDFADGVGQVIRVVARNTIPLGFVPPDDDGAMVLVGLRSHDDGNHLLQEEIALQDLCRIAGQVFEAGREGCVLVIELVGVMKLYWATPLVFRSANNCCSGAYWKRSGFAVVKSLPPLESVKYTCGLCFAA